MTNYAFDRGAKAMQSLFFLVLVLILSYVSTVFAQQDEKQINCLSLNIYHEARGENKTGQMAVAIVTMNRVMSSRYPNTVCKVVWQSRQFSWTQDGKSDHPKDSKAWELAEEVAEFVYHKYEHNYKKTNGAVDITGGALFYYAPKLVNPYWAAKKVKTVQIGNHVFMREKL